MARYSKQKSRMNRDEHSAFVPMLKTVEQMALISGIGENKLRQLMADREPEVSCKAANWSLSRTAIGV